MVISYVANTVLGITFELVQHILAVMLLKMCVSVLNTW